MGMNDDRPKPARNAKGHLLPGHTANPGGRTRKFKGLAKMVREVCEDGQQLVDFAHGVFVNETKIYTHSQQWDAFNWLADRGFGKAVSTTIELGADSDEAVAGMDLVALLASKTDDQLNEDEAAVDAMLARYSQEVTH